MKTFKDFYKAEQEKSINESYKHQGVIDLPYDDLIEFLESLSNMLTPLSYKNKIKYKDNFSYDGVYVGEMFFDSSALNDIKTTIERVVATKLKGQKIEHIFNFYNEELEFRIGVIGFSNSGICNINNSAGQLIKKELFTKIR